MHTCLGDTSYNIRMSKLFCLHSLGRMSMNQSFLIMIELKTSMEMLIGKPTDYSSLHIFDYSTHVTYYVQERMKFDWKYILRLCYVDEVKRDIGCGTIKVIIYQHRCYLYRRM